ncbi:MAG TPA: hypothetical protein P5040_03860 [Smithella sp.]|nr:hypothetical protein [Smithella sp.]
MGKHEGPAHGMRDKTGAGLCRNVNSKQKYRTSAEAGRTAKEVLKYEQHYQSRHHR